MLFLPHLSPSQDQVRQEMSLKYPAEVPKVDLKTQRFLEKLPSDSAVAVWVFFTDKGIESFAQYRTALDETVHRLSERSLRRRMLRGREPQVDLTDIPVEKRYLDELENIGAKIRVVSRWLNGASVSADKQQIEKIKNLPFVRAVKKVATFTRSKPEAEKNRLRKTGKPYGEQDLGYGESYAQLAQIHVPELHRIGLSGAGVLITLLDTGFSVDHSAFEHILNSGRLIATHDFINGDDDVDDGEDNQRAHGTSVFSVVGGLVEDTLIGCAYGAQFALAKTEIQAVEIEIEEDYWIAGLEWGEALGTDVVSSSLGYTDWYTYQDMDGNTALCTRAADLAVSKGVVVVNAAGNERDDQWYYIIAPADGDSVIAAGAVDLNNQIASFSSAGPTYDGRIKPDVCACGVGTYCANAGGGYSHLRGTSFATPLVAGVCALLLEAHPTANPVRVREALWTTASQADNPDNLMGYGIADASKAGGFSLVVSPQKLSFEASFGDTQSQQMILNLSDYWQGEGLKWKALTADEWISIAPDSGGTPEPCSVTVYPTGLKAGINRGSIIISSWNTISSEQEITVVLTLHPSNQVLCFPNPFTDTLTVLVNSPDVSRRIKISVFTVAGELLCTFPEEYTESYQHIWNGTNEKGEKVASGIYLLKVDIGDQSKMVKVAKVK
jgi:serine protease AprX